MESEESQQCLFCGLAYINWKFHLGVHNECKMLEEKRSLLGRKSKEVEGLEEALRLVDSHLQPDLDEEEDVDELEEKPPFEDVDEQEEVRPFEDMEQLDETMSFEDVDEKEEMLSFENEEELDETGSFEDLDELEEAVSFEDMNQQPDVIGHVGDLDEEDEDTVPFEGGIQPEEVVDQDEDTLPFEVVEPNLVWNLVSIEDLPEETSNSAEVSSSPDGKTKTFRLKDLFQGSS